MRLFRPNWHSENERTACRRCSPTAYALYVLSDWLTLASLLYLPAYLLGKLPGGVLYALLPWLAGQFGLRLHDRLLEKRRFRFDYERNYGIWRDKHGVRRQYPDAKNRKKGKRA